jgi:hypothetical protein
MWQAHYYLARTRIRELAAEADRRQRWMLDGNSNGRPAPVIRTPNRLRAGTARVVAVLSRITARFALRLDSRVCVEAGQD